MRHNLGRPSNTNVFAPKLLFKATVHPFNIGTFVVTTILWHLIVNGLEPFGLRLQLFLQDRISPGVYVNEWHMPEELTVLSDDRCIICRVHQVI